MLAEIRNETGRTDVDVLGVNAAGEESGNALMVAGRTLPLLQDEAGVDAWGLWQVEWRDVFVLDAENRPYAVVNLTTHDLADPDEYASLKATILAAMDEPSAP